MLDLGEQPPCERFPEVGADDHDAHPLRMWSCHHCGLAQLVDDAGAVEEQLVVVEPAAMVEQMHLTLDLLEEEGTLRDGARVVEFGSPHAGSWLPELTRRGAVVPEPTPSPAFDLAVDVYGLLHEPDQERALRRRVDRLAAGGSIVFQLHSIAAAVATRNWAELRHGHFAYWSVPQLGAALRSRGLGVHRYRRFPLDGATAVVVAQRDAAPDTLTNRLLREDTDLDREAAAGLMTLQREADTMSGSLGSWLARERTEGRLVVGYGAASRAVPVLCRAHVDRSLMCAIGDASPAKQGRRMPGTDVPIVSPEAIIELRPDRVLLFLPDLLEEVRRTMPEIEAAGARWVVAGSV